MATDPTSRLSRPGDVPLAVWPVAQTSAQYQRAGRYHPDSTEHPGKMVPALAARIIEEYSAPGDLVVDPMAGIGTTLVEAALLGRRAVGVELEARWVALTEANLAHAVPRRAMAPRPKILEGDARRLPALLGRQSGRVDLVVVSPPYGCDAGVIDKPGWREGKRLCPADTLNYSTDKSNLSTDKANLGHALGPDYLAAMTEIYAACHEVLQPSGLLVTVLKNPRRHGRLVDLAGATVALARSVGFAYLQHVVALLGPIRDGELSGRPSFWQLTQTRKARARGEPAHLGIHEDVCVFRSEEAQP